MLSVSSAASKASMSSSARRRKKIEFFLQVQRLHHEKEALERDQSKEAQNVNINELPDYMTLRRKRIDEKKAKKLHYTLEITDKLFKPNYKTVKSKLAESIVPDDVEQSLQN